MAEDKPQLTLNDPVNPEDLARLNELDNAQNRVAQRNLQLDQEKIGCMAAARRLSAEIQTIFDKVLSERGIPPKTAVNIDPKTGAVELLQAEVPETPAGESA